jgi:hypothetical protein
MGIRVVGLSVMGVALLGMILTTTPSKKKRTLCKSRGKGVPRSELLSRPRNKKFNDLPQ